MIGRDGQAGDYNLCRLLEKRPVQPTGYGNGGYPRAITKWTSYFVKYDGDAVIAIPRQTEVLGAGRVIWVREGT
jgi:hypothetical protein